MILGYVSIGMLKSVCLFIELNSFSFIAHQHCSQWRPLW